MLDQITYLFRLQVIAEAGSLRRAATLLNVTQPALTRSIAQLEKHFGQAVLTRHSKGVSLTEFGARVMTAASRLSRYWEIAESDLAHPSSAMRGRLRLRAGPLWRAVVLPEIISELQNTFPAVVIEIGSSLRGETAADLSEGRIDAVFGGIEMPEGPGQRLRQLQFTTVYDRVVARENHPIFKASDGKGNCTPQRLLDYPWIVYTADPVYELETVHGAIERLGQAPDIRVRSESLVAVIGFLQRGDYLCMLPEAAVAGANSPKILPVPVEFGGRMIRSGIIFREEMSEWPPMVELLKLCERHFAKQHGATASKALPT